MKKITVTAAFLGFLGVAFGAFGAHALREQLTLNATIQTWDTAVLYHLIHASLALVITSRAAKSEAWVRRAALAWIVGIFLFSGSLYGLALNGPRFLGPVTPIGGLSFLLGWTFAGWAAWKHQSESTAP